MIQIVSMLAIIACWMCGGQFEKSIRRYGIATIIIALCTWRIMNGATWWIYAPLALLCPELFLGYGTGSWAAKWFREEFMIRLMYAIALAIPIVLCGALQFHWLCLWSVPLLIIAFQIRAGSLFHVADKDFLIEDFFRSLALATSIWLIL